MNWVCYCLKQDNQNNTLANKTDRSGFIIESEQEIEKERPMLRLVGVK